MFHYNLEKSEIRNVYYVRASVDTILLSSVENFVFTGARIRLPKDRWTRAILRQSSHSAFVNNKHIEVPQRCVESSDNNLIVRVLNNGPIDVWVKARDILAEVSLFPEPDVWKKESRRPDYKDLFLFGSLCERLRVIVLRKRKSLTPIYRSEVRPETDVLLDLLQDLDYAGAFDEQYRAALSGESSLFDPTDCEVLPAASGVCFI